MLLLINILLFFLIINLSLVLVFNKHFCEVFILSLIIPSFILMAFGFINRLALGLYFIIIVSLLLIAYFYIKNKNYFMLCFKNKYVSIGLVFSILLIVYSYYLGIHKMFSSGDEFWLWGTRVLQMINYNSIRNINANTLYPRTSSPMFLGCLESLFCLLNGSFNDGLCYIGITVFYFSMSIHFLRDYKYQNLIDWIKAFLIVLAFIVVGTSISKFEDCSIYSTLYADYIMAAFGSLCVYKVLVFNYNFKSFDFLLIIIYLIALIQIDHAGILYAMISLALLVIQYMFFSVNNKRTRNILIYISVISILISIKLFSIPSILNNVSKYSAYIFSDSYWEHKVFTQYTNDLFNYKSAPGLIKLPVFYYLIILLIIIFIFSHFIFNNKKKSIILTLLLLFGGIANAFACLMYYFRMCGSRIFEDYILLLSYERYLGGYLYFVLFLLLLIAILLINNIKREKLQIEMLIIMSVGSLLTTDIKTLNNELIKLGKDKHLDQCIYDFYYEFFEIPVESKILIIEQYMEPILVDTYRETYFVERFDYDLTTIQLGTTSHKYDFHTQWNVLDLSIDEYMKYVCDFDYIAVYYPDDYFINKYWNNSTNAELYKYCVYSVNGMNEGKLLLNPIIHK